MALPTAARRLPGGSGAFGGAAGAGGSAATAGIGGSAAVGGSSGTGGACTDPGIEPNETEATATHLASITDCDGTGGSITGVLRDASDVDFYTYFGSDTFGCIVDPFAAASAGVRLCMYALGATCGSGTPDVSPEGRSGCCSTSSVSLSGLNTDSTVYISVDQPVGACVAYNVSYHF